MIKLNKIKKKNITQKQNKVISHVRLNNAEIAYSLGIKKEEYSMIIQNIILYIDNSIIIKLLFLKKCHI